MSPTVKELKKEKASKKLVGLRKQQVWEEHLKIAEEKKGQPNRKKLRSWQRANQKVESKIQQKNRGLRPPSMLKLRPRPWSPSIDPALSNKLRLKLARGDKKLLESKE